MTIGKPCILLTIIALNSTAHSYTTSRYIFSFLMLRFTLGSCLPLFCSLRDLLYSVHFSQDHASNTEEALVGKQLLTSASLALALETLQSELKPDHVKPEPSIEFRKGLACALFYKVSTAIPMFCLMRPL